MGVIVTKEHLLRGAAYALEQSGFLLRDANALFRNGSYASAVVLAAFALEESGKSKLLFNLRREVVQGKKVADSEVDKLCRDHGAKQREAIAGITISDGSAAELIKDLMNTELGSSEREALDEKIKIAVDEKLKRLPGDRHDNRMAALYVDPLSPTEWGRPVERIPKETAYNFLLGAGNDYSGRARKYEEPALLAAEDSELSEALKTWTSRPMVPNAEWPPPLES